MIDLLNYTEFKKYLDKQLRETESNELNGFETLYDYYLDNPPDYLENDGSDFFHEEIDGLAQDKIDEVNVTLQENESSWLEVKSGKWKLKETSTKTKINKSKLLQSLTMTEEVLLRRVSGEIDSTERKALINLYNSKVKNLGTEKEKYQTSRLIVDKFVYSGDNGEKYEQFVIAAGELGSKNKDKDSYRYFEYLAKFYRKRYEHEESACWYNRAALSAVDCNEDKNIILDITRNERLQFEQSGKEDEASKAYIRENDLIAQIDGGRKMRSIYFILKHISDYFQNPKKVLFWALIVILISSVAFSISGITPSGEAQQSWRTGEFFSNESFEEFGDALYFSLVTFTTLGYGDYAPSNLVSRFFANLVSMGGLLLASLFLVTLVKKYGR